MTNSNIFKFQYGGYTAKSDNTRVYKKPSLKFKLTQDQKNTPITVGKITTIPKKEMALKNSIPNTVQSQYVGFVKDKGSKLPTYIQYKVSTITEEKFSKYISKLDKAMQKTGFRKVNDPNVQYRAYTNGKIVVDDISPDNIGLTFFRKPKMIDFNIQTVPEWVAQGFTLRNGSKLSY